MVPSHVPVPEASTCLTELSSQLVYIERDKMMNLHFMTMQMPRMTRGANIDD